MKITELTGQPEALESRKPVTGGVQRFPAVPVVLPTAPPATAGAGSLGRTGARSPPSRSERGNGIAGATQRRRTAQDLAAPPSPIRGRSRMSRALRVAA